MKTMCRPPPRPIQAEGHKGVLNEVSVTFIDKTDGEDRKKEKDIGCKH